METFLLYLTHTVVILSHCFISTICGSHILQASPFSFQRHTSEQQGKSEEVKGPDSQETSLISQKETKCTGVTVRRVQIELFLSKIKDAKNKNTQKIFKSIHNKCTKT